MEITLVYQIGGSRLFSKVHDLTNPRKLARFPVPGMISLLLSGLNTAVVCHQHVTLTVPLQVSFQAGQCCSS